MWYDIKTAADMLQLSPDTLYCAACVDKKKGLDYRFKKVGRNTLCNVDAYYRRKPTYETQKMFEELYFELIEIIPTKQKLYQMIAQIIGKKEHAVCMYFYDMFITGSEQMKRKYIDAMIQIKQGLQ